MQPLFRGHTKEAWRYILLKGSKTSLPAIAAVLALLRNDFLDILVLSILAATIPFSLVVDMAFSSFVAGSISRGGTTRGQMMRPGLKG